MNVDVSARELQLKELRQFISNARKKILDVTSELQWDPKTLEKGKEMVVCPFDEGHVIPKSSLKQHIENCNLRKERYHPEDVLFPPVSVDPSSSSVLKVDSKFQAYILKQAKEKKPDMLIGFPGQVDDREVPMSSDRLMTTLTSDEKSALHSYVIANTVSPGEGKDICLNDQDLEINYKNKKEEKKDKTPLEKLIEERDAKRRKEGKKVHINRKSHTEIVREVIENQMEIYVEWLRDENLLEEDESNSVEVKPEAAQALEEEEIKDNEIDEGNDDCLSKEDSKPPFAYDDREIYKENGHYKGRGKDVDHSDSRWKNERRMGNSSWSSNSREDDGKSYRDYESTRYKDYESSRYKNDESSRYKDYESSRHKDCESSRHKDYESSRHKDYESSRHRDYDSRHYREWDYDRKRKRNRREDRVDDYEYTEASKNEDTWDGGSPVIKQEYDEEQVERSGKVDSGKDRERKRHKSKRRHRESDSESDHNSKHKKKKKKSHKRSD